jgi:hypothetical protein
MRCRTPKTPARSAFLCFGAAAPPLGKSPWLCTDDLSFTVRPKVDDHSHEVIEAGVGALVDKEGGEREKRESGQAGLDAAVDGRAGHEFQRPLPRQHSEAHEDVEDLQYRRRFHGRVEALGEEIEENLGPEDALKAGNNLVSCGRDGDEPRPVVLDESAHFAGSCNGLSSCLGENLPRLLLVLIRCLSVFLPIPPFVEWRRLTKPPESQDDRTELTPQINREDADGEKRQASLVKSNKAESK